MKIAFTELKLVLEPSGALGLAALLDGKIDCLEEGDGVVVVACGGNVAVEDYCRLLA
jgi:threonine dehydratase